MRPARTARVVVVVVIGRCAHSVVQYAGAILGALIVWIFRSWIATDTAFFGFILKTSDASPGLITPGALNMLVYGLLIVLVLMFAPRGLLSLWDRFARSVGRRLFP